MARKRPTASAVSQIPADAAARDGSDVPDALTHAQAHALRRCAPLSSSEFKAQRRVIAQQHRWSVMRLLHLGADDEHAPVR